MSGPERRCRLLLRAYPAWYRRERAGEMIDTLLQANPSDRGWPGLRESWLLVFGGLRVRGWLWLLSMLWVGLGAGGVAYAAITFAHAPYDAGFRFMLQWPTEPQLVIDAGVVAEVMWLMLSAPVLVAGCVWLLLDRGPRKVLRVAGWAGSWVAGLVLLYQCVAWLAAGEGGRHGVLSVGELVLCALWLVLGMVMTAILSWSVPGGRRATEAGLA